MAQPDIWAASDSAGIVESDLESGQPKDRPAGGSAGGSVHGWVRFGVERFAGLILVALALVIATFFMVRLLPGDPALYIASAGGGQPTQSEVHAIEQQLDLNRPLMSQLVTYVGNAAHGDFGNSFVNTTESARSEVLHAVGPSVVLASAAIVLVLIASIVGGILMAHLTRDGLRPRLEVLFTAFNSILGSLPAFFLGTLFVLLFAVTWHLFPAGGDQGWKSLVLPALALAIPCTALLIRIVRTETLNALAQDYVRTARSKRLSRTRIYCRHVLPNVITGALAIGGVLFSALIGSAVVVENLFARPGLGTTLVTAIENRDYPVVQASIVAIGLVVAIVNIFVDVLIGVVNPRVRSRSHGH